MVDGESDGCNAGAGLMTGLKRLMSVWWPVLYVLAVRSLCGALAGVWLRLSVCMCMDRSDV
jgi:hypothetical protein